MNFLAIGLTGLVAFEHFYFFLLEAVLWTKPIGLKTFNMTPEKAETTKVLAMNQGLYNTFLSAGLVWSLVADPAIGGPVRVFFLVCVIVAGVVGAATVSPRILFVQAVPAAAALAAFFVSRS